MISAFTSTRAEPHRSWEILLEPARRERQRLEIVWESSLILPPITPLAELLLLLVTSSRETSQPEFGSSTPTPQTMSCKETISAQILQGLKNLPTATAFKLEPVLRTIRSAGRQPAPVM